MELTKDFIASKLLELETKDIVPIHNEYCEVMGYEDNRVEYMDSLDDIFCDTTPLNIAMRIFYGDFNPNDNFFTFNGYGNLVSFDYYDDSNSPIEISELAEWLADSPNYLKDYFDDVDMWEDEEDE